MKIKIVESNLFPHSILSKTDYLEVDKNEDLCLIKIKDLKSYSLASEKIAIAIVENLNDHDKSHLFSLGFFDYIDIKTPPHIISSMLKCAHIRSNKKNKKYENSYHPEKRKLITKNRKVISLSHVENKIFQLLTEKSGEAVSKEHLFTMLEESTNIRSTRSLDNAVTRLRLKLEKTDHPLYLQTLYGSGYILNG